MPKTLQLIRSCNHIVSTDESKEMIRTVRRSSDTDYDILIRNNTVLEIISVTQVDEESITYQQNVDYILYTHNKIRWIGQRKPVNGSLYNVVFVVDASRTLKYDIQNCPKCGGNGWYVSFFDDESSQLNAITGVFKLAQDVMKLILTKKDDNNYGTNLTTNIVGQPVTDEGSLITAITSEIISAENKYKEIQSNEMFRGVIIPDDERLRNIEIQDIYFDKQMLAVYVNLILYNYVGESAELSFKL